MKIFVKCPVDGVKNNGSMKVDFVCFVLLQLNGGDNYLLGIINWEQITENEALLSLFFTLALDISVKALIILE